MISWRRRAPTTSSCRQLLKKRFHSHADTTKKATENTDVGSPLAERVAVVTGGGRGIGRAIALALARAGARTIVLARSRAELATTVENIETAGGKGHAFTVDVTDHAMVQSVMANIETTFGSIDVLVNNAGIAGPIEPFAQSPIEAWWRTVDVNLRGPVNCTHAVLPGMIERRRGRIVNIATSPVPIAYFSAYVTGKTGLMRFTETVAAEVKPHRVYMFALGPGTVRTAMSEHSLVSPEGRKWLPWFARIFERGLDIPPERPAQFVVALASGCADELSGRFITVDDDIEMLRRRLPEIEKSELYSLRVRKLDDRAPSPLSDIHATAKNA